jgi:uncharacterized SAM-binding protein YcdF (DUF218 family)
VLLDPWWWVALPLGLAVLLRGRRRLAAGLLATALTLFVIASLPAVANRAWRALEADAASTMRADTTYDVVVLLGGTVSALGASADEVSWGDNVERLTVTFDLLRAGRARHVIVSGGALRDGLPTEAEFLARQLEAWGIAKERIIVEPEARNTAENAQRSKALVDARGFRSIVIVTSAFHMPRSLGCFRAAGLDPDTLAVDYRMRAPEADGHWLPRATYLQETSEVVHELAGRLVYRLTGKSK